MKKQYTTLSRNKEDTMSLWCGSCQQEIFEGFGLLYQLERDDAGNLRLPSHKAEYVPANSAICDPCWRALPDSEKNVRDVSEVETLREPIFAFTEADSNNDPFWGSKTWSGITAKDEHFIFLRRAIVEAHFAHTLVIIDHSTRRRKEYRRLREIALN